MHAESLNRVQLFETLWTVAHRDPLSMGSLRQKYWTGLPFPSPGNLTNPGTEPMSSILAGQGSPESARYGFKSLSSRLSMLLPWACSPNTY